MCPLLQPSTGGEAAFIPNLEHGGCDTMSANPGSSSELRATIRLSRSEIAHLWHGGILSLKVEGGGMEADLELRCPEVESTRGTRILIKRVSAE